MNARQMKKKLKWEISRLKSNNNLMRKIIADSPTMLELYDRYNKPLNVRHSTIEFQEYKAKRSVPFYMTDVDGFDKFVKNELAKEIFEGIRDNISYDVDSECGTQIITASIFVGIK